MYIERKNRMIILLWTEIAEGAYNYCIKVAEHHNLIDSISKFSADTMLEKVHYLPARNHYQLLAAVQILKQFVAENSKVLISFFLKLTFFKND